MRRFEAQNDADALVTLGDNDYTESPATFRAAWRGSFGWLRPAGVAVAGSLGNHDVRVQRGRYQFATLSMPGPYYRRQFGDVELFVLDSNNVNAVQTSWLERALASSNCFSGRWRSSTTRLSPAAATTRTPTSSGAGCRSSSATASGSPSQDTITTTSGSFRRRGRDVRRSRRRSGSVLPDHRPAGRGIRAESARAASTGGSTSSSRTSEMIGWTVNMSGRRTDRFTVLPEYR